MPRKPKPKNTLSAGERAKLYEAEQQEKQNRMRSLDTSASEEMAPTPKAEAQETIGQKNENSANNMPQKAKKELPKPQKAVVKVDFSIPTGDIKPMHGMCNGPVSYGADISELFREIGVPYVRFDGTDTAISQCAVDISRIFKDPDADPASEENYDFKTTDLYVERALLTGAKVIFRLGESIDMLSGKRVECNMDPEDLARVCVNIIRHYNSRWAEGYTFGIEYFEIWNLAPAASDGERTKTKDLETYRHIANAVKIYDESLKVGGMSFPSFDGAREFLRYCNKNNTPVDFVTVDLFEGNVEKIAKDAERLSSFLRNSDLDEIEIIVGKWAYIDEKLTEGKKPSAILGGSNENLVKIRNQILSSQATVKGAAFAAALMIRLGEIRNVEAACHFDAQPILSPFCSISDRFGEPQKPFYVFKAYGDLYRAGKAVLCESLGQDGMAPTGIYAAASLADWGEGYVMIASFDGCGTVDLRIDGIPDELYTADVYMLDGVKNMTLAQSVPISGMKKRMVVNLSPYAALLIKLY